MSQNVLSKIPASVCAGAALAGLVLIALIVVLPERMQSGAVCGGVALTLGGIAASLADKSWLHWKKLSPASAILLGAVLVGASAFWHPVARTVSACRCPPSYSTVTLFARLRG